MTEEEKDAAIMALRSLIRSIPPEIFLRLDKTMVLHQMILDLPRDVIEPLILTAFTGFTCRFHQL